MRATTEDRLPGPRGLASSARLVRDLTSDPCPALDEAARRYGPTFSVGAGPLRMVVVGGPDHIDELLATPSAAFRWGHWANVLSVFVGEGSIIVSDGEPHRRRRAEVQPAFARRRLDGWVPMIVTETDRAIDRDLLGRGGVVDLFPVQRRLVLTIVLKALFGGGLDDHVEEIDALVGSAKGYLEQPVWRQVPHPFPRTRRAEARAARMGLDRLIDAEVARRRRSRDSAATDVLDVLMAGSESGELSMAEVRDQVRTLIGAGYDTTTSALAWTTLRAAADPEVWARLRAEADDVLAGDLGPDTVPRLACAAAVVRETLRLHPPGVFSPRQATRPVPVGPHVVPKGAMVLWSPYLAGRDPRAWDDPLDFRPDRHLTPTPEAEHRARTAWVPFGRGPRRCIGFALAQMELTLVVARLAQRVDLELASSAVPAPIGMVVNRPAGGVPARVRARDGTAAP